MSNENANQSIYDTEIYDDFIDFDVLESKLQASLDEQFREFEFKQEDMDKMQDPSKVSDLVVGIVWDNFLNQMAVTAGQEFIKDNHDLTLDLRNCSHIQTTANFEKGNIATRNTEINYQKRYDDYQNSFQKNEDGSEKLGRDNKAVLKKEARELFDKNRDKGTKRMHKDHTVSVSEIRRDTKANAHLDVEEQIEFANSKDNLKDLDSLANMSKGDKPMKEWLNSLRNGRKPTDRFDIDEKELLKNDDIAREEFEKLKATGEKKSKQTGKQSQKEEAFKIGKTALKGVLMALLADLMKRIGQKLIVWFKSTKRDLNTLLSYVKEASVNFVHDLKKHLVNAGSSLITTIITAIVGPIVRTLKRVWGMLKQGWKSLQEATDYMTKPENKDKPIDQVMLEVGKIVVLGLAAMGTISLSDALEKGLSAIPVMVFEIPLLGSLASILSMFLSGMIAGVIGAIALNLIDGAITKNKLESALNEKIELGNDILKTQHNLINVSNSKLNQCKSEFNSGMTHRHSTLYDQLLLSSDKIMDTSLVIESESTDNIDTLDNLVMNLDLLED